MTQVGHSIAAATIALTVLPSRATTWGKILTVLVFAGVANIPDLRLPHWGHERYDISHSVFVNLALIAVAAAPFVLLPRLRRAVGGGAVVIAGAGAWLSHLLLDTFYNHGLGLAMFWPFSKARLALPIPWFETLRKPFPHFDAHTARVWAIELLFYGLIFLTALLARRTVIKQWGAGRPSSASAR